MRLLLRRRRLVIQTQLISTWSTVDVSPRWSADRSAEALRPSRCFSICGCYLHCTTLCTWGQLQSNMHWRTACWCFSFSVNFKASASTSRVFWQFLPCGELLSNENAPSFTLFWKCPENMQFNPSNSPLSDISSQEANKDGYKQRVKFVEI